MPDLDPDDLPQEVYLPPALRPGGSVNRPVISRPAPERRDRRVPPTRAEMLAMARSLLDRLLGGLVDDPEAAVEALLALGRRDGRRAERRAERRPERGPLDPLGDEPGVPVAASRLTGEVRTVLDAHLAAPASDDLVAQAALGVEFAAQVEASGARADGL